MLTITVELVLKNYWWCYRKCSLLKCDSLWVHADVVLLPYVLNVNDGVGCGVFY
jgi:hypothetical protein